MTTRDPQADIQAETPQGARPVERYFDMLLAGDAEGLLVLFAGVPRLDLPRFGRVESDQGLRQFVAVTRPWLETRQARVEPVALTAAGERSVWEVVLHLTETRDGQAAIALPMALVAEAGQPNDGAETLAALRVYHSLWPLLGAHQVRPPLLRGRRLTVPDVVGRYQAALSAGDVEGVLKCFEPDGQAREPSGGPYLYQGPERLREFYGSILAGGGIGLEHCALTDDGTRCAIEYNAVRWGQTELAPQAGVAVYERGPGGLLAAARIYDDVSPPVG